MWRQWSNNNETSLFMSSLKDESQITIISVILCLQFCPFLNGQYFVDNKRLTPHFQSINCEKVGSIEVSSKPENKCKNRYANILACKFNITVTSTEPSWCWTIFPYMLKFQIIDQISNYCSNFKRSIKFRIIAQTSNNCSNFELLPQFRIIAQISNYCSNVELFIAQISNYCSNFELFKRTHPSWWWIKDGIRFWKVSKNGLWCVVLI